MSDELDIFDKAKVRAHVGWLKIYTFMMTPENWRDMRDYCTHQLGELSAIVGCDPPSPDSHLTERERMRAVIWTAWRELNAIRARDGAPCGVDPNYFSAVVDACETVLGDDTKPWPNKLWLQQDGSFSFDAILQRLPP